MKHTFIQASFLQVLLLFQGCLCVWTQDAGLKVEGGPQIVGMESWKVSLLYSPTIVVQGEFKNKASAVPVKIDVANGEENGAVDAIVCEFDVERVMYAEPSITNIAAFFHCKEHPERKFSIKVHFLGLKEQLDANVNRVVVMNYDLWGRLYFLPSDQHFTESTLQKCLEERQAIWGSWRNSFLQSK